MFLLSKYASRPKNPATARKINSDMVQIVVPAKAFVRPVQKGHETMNMPTFAFLIENKKLAKKIMFDLGCRKDWWNLTPAAQDSVTSGIPALHVPKSINEVLREGGMDDKKIDGVVWSHWHWDRTLSFQSSFTPICTLLKVARHVA